MFTYPLAVMTNHPLAVLIVVLVLFGVLLFLGYGYSPVSAKPKEDPLRVELNLLIEQLTKHTHTRLDPYVGPTGTAYYLTEDAGVFGIGVVSRERYIYTYCVPLDPTEQVTYLDRIMADNNRPGQDEMVRALIEEAMHPQGDPRIASAGVIKSLNKRLVCDLSQTHR